MCYNLSIVCSKASYPDSPSVPSTSKFHYLLFSLRSTISCLRLLSLLLVPSIFHSTCFKSTSMVHIEYIWWQNFIRVLLTHRNIRHVSTYLLKAIFRSVTQERIKKIQCHVSCMIVEWLRYQHFYKISDMYELSCKLSVTGTTTAAYTS
jgi:hypothetical protein